MVFVEMSDGDPGAHLNEHAAKKGTFRCRRIDYNGECVYVAHIKKLGVMKVCIGHAQW
jgi:hypothetical protein